MKNYISKKRDIINSQGCHNLREINKTVLKVEMNAKDRPCKH